MNYSLGVDVGTTFTAVAIDRSGRTEIAPLGDRGWTMPSVVYLGEDQQVVVGDAAVRRATTDPGRGAREFKRRMGDSVPIILGSTPLSADFLTGMVLGSAVRNVIDLETEPPNHIVITHPASWGQFKVDFMWQAVRLAGVDQLCPVSFTTEPEAAAAYYASGERLDVGDVIAVYDLGGGTFDIAVLRRTHTGWDFLAPADGIERLGGVDFDEAVFSYVNDATGGRVASLDPTDSISMSAVQQLRRECVAAKEALSVDVEVTIRVALPTYHGDVRLTRSEFEAMVESPIGLSIESTQRALKSAGVPPGGLTAVLLVGGSSRIPLVAERVAQILGARVAVDVHPKHSIALGAALTADLRANAPRTLPPESTVASTGSATAPGGANRRVSIMILAGVVAIAVAVVAFLIFRPSGQQRGGASVATLGLESPVVVTTPTPASNNSSGVTTTSTLPSRTMPVAVRVSSVQEWTDSGVDCAPGTELRITATGTVLHNNTDTASTVGPDGLTEPFFHQFNVDGLPDANTVALIGSIDRGQPFFVVGSATTYACQSAGRLFLGVNDVGLDNNSGAFEASVLVEPQ